MPYKCKGVCKTFKPRPAFHVEKYLNGFKRCTTCGIFFKFLNLRCPCCGTKLRTKSRLN